MLYTPSEGRFKDTHIHWHDGVFYLFSMHTPGPEDQFRNVWMAKSTDGVHWEHLGQAIHAPFNVWAMMVYPLGDRFILNHGSFTRSDLQNVLRFWESKDLLNWTFLGHEHDVTPDTRWVSGDSRLDCMDVVPVEVNGKTVYYGYATGPGGFLVSNDGLSWTGLPQPVIDWDTVPPPPTPGDEGGFEIGGCQPIAGKYYLVGGWFNYMGSRGYGVYTLIGDSPTGPFRADSRAYRLCGQSARWVALWARFIRKPGELLVNSYMYSGHTYETGVAYLPPIKKPITDDRGHLRLAYWSGNDALKATPIRLDASHVTKRFADGSDECLCSVSGDTVTVQAQPETMSLQHACVTTTIAYVDQPMDFDAGIVFEAEICITARNPRLVAPSIGFVLEETDNEGTAILFHSYGLTQIGKVTLTTPMTFSVEDVITPGCAAPAGLSPHTPHRVRLLMRKNMFEVYLDEWHVQTFNTSHEPDVLGHTPRRIGLIVQSGVGTFSQMRAWQMDLKD